MVTHESTFRHVHVCIVLSCHQQSSSSSSSCLTRALLPTALHPFSFGVQKNWFTALYKQLNYAAKTGAVPSLKGRARPVGTVLAPRGVERGTLTAA